MAHIDSFQDLRRRGSSVRGLGSGPAHRTQWHLSTLISTTCSTWNIGSLSPTSAHRRA